MLFEYTALLLGLCNAPSTFQCLINAVALGYMDKLMLIYLNSILIYSITADEHEVHLCKVFASLHEKQVAGDVKEMQVW